MFGTSSTSLCRKSPGDINWREKKNKSLGMNWLIYQIAKLMKFTSQKWWWWNSVQQILGLFILNRTIKEEFGCAIF